MSSSAGKWFANCELATGPKYIAIANAIKTAVQQGHLKPGDKLPTHRALADALGVTVGTVTRGYAEAEQQALTESKVGSGTFIRYVDEAMDFCTFEGVPDSMIDLSYSFAPEQQQAEAMAAELASLASDPQLVASLLRYQPVTGLLAHQQAAHQWFALTGITLDTSRPAIITNGGQHGFYSAVLGLTRSGDTVAAAGLTYPGFIAVTRQLGLIVEGVAFDQYGILPEAFDTLCQHSSPKLLYVGTRVNNPSCEVMSAARIDAIADVARRHGVWIVEDDVQGCLNGDATATFAELHPDITVLVSSTSKVLAGGLRVGYVLPPTELFVTIANAVKSSCWMAAPLCSELVSRWILSGQAEQLLQSQRALLQQRHELAREALAGHQFNAVVTGLNVWLFMPPHRRANEFSAALEKRNVLVKSSSGFATGHFAVPQAVRFCLGGAISDAQLQQALAVIRHELSIAPADIEFSH